MGAVAAPTVPPAQAPLHPPLLTAAQVANEVLEATGFSAAAPRTSPAVAKAPPPSPEELIAKDLIETARSAAARSSAAAVAKTTPVKPWKAPPPSPEELAPPPVVYDRPYNKKAPPPA